MGGVVSERESKILSIIETARAKRAKFRDPRITMSHGAGGKATTSLVEGLFVPAFASPSLDALGDAGAVRVDGLDLALTTDYRQVLGEVVTRALGAENLETVFPGAQLSRAGFLKLV